MKQLTLLLATVLLVNLFATGKLLAQNDYYFPDAGSFDPAIPTPEDFLGYEIGSHHTRYDRIVSYFQELAKLSDRVSYQEIGYTVGHRPTIVLTITSPENHANLEQIRQDHLTISDPNRVVNDFSDHPIVVYLGYGVHGNETSSSEAALLTAYYLTASLSDEVETYLDEGVFFIDPTQNPDGRDRHSHWANMHKGDPLVADPLDREHNEGWPNGRTNHYWFDLNRDWLPLVHPESRAKVAFHHQWYPNVTTDFHEMGTNSTYFFEPTKPIGSENPLLPREVYTVLTETLSGYFAEALDGLGSLYFTKEVFDNTYPGYGSTYPNFLGGLGLVFEQASARGHLQENEYGELSFAFTIRNQLASSLATIRGAVENRELFLRHQQDFFTSALDDAAADPVKAYVFGDPYDRSRTDALANLLLEHNLELYRLSATREIDGASFDPEYSYIVPASQPHYRLVRSAFEKVSEFADSTFYGTTAWSLALAYGLPHAELSGGNLPLGEQITKKIGKPTTPHVPQSNYSYLLDWSDYYAPGALYHLQKNGVITHASFGPFTAATHEGEREYSRGSISVPVSVQKISPEELHELVKEAEELTGVRFQSVSSGLSVQGADLGSRSFRTLKAPRVLMPVGHGLSVYEAGQIWHLLDTKVKLPVTKVDWLHFGRADLSRYDTIVLVPGNYQWLTGSRLEDLKQWVRNGGTLIAIKNAVTWAISNGLVTDEYLTKQAGANTVAASSQGGNDGAEERTSVLRLNFEDAPNNRGAGVIGGTIFETDLDITHPLGFGYHDRTLAVYRDHTITLPPAASPYNTVAQYRESPHISGFVSDDNLARISNSAALAVDGAGSGRVILFVDNPNFWGYWYGTNRLFLNAIFFGQHISAP